MKLLITFLSLILLLLAHKTHSTPSNKIIFTGADIELDYETEDGWVKLEAFKCASNDIITKNVSKNAYNQLKWFSIGVPTLTEPKLSNFKPESFEISVEMLTQAHRLVLKELIDAKYETNVSTKQILNLVPSKFECSISFHHSGADYQMKGQAHQLNKSPLRVKFYSPLKSIERTAFEERFKNEASLDINCEFAYEPHFYRKLSFNTKNSAQKMHVISDNLAQANEHLNLSRKLVENLFESPKISVEMRRKISEIFQLSLKQFNGINEILSLLRSMLSKEEVEMKSEIENNVDSVIISKQEIKKLYELGRFNESMKLKLLYRASVDGNNTYAFHEKCDNIKNTFTVVKSSAGHVFGGFTTQKWNHRPKFLNDSDAFLFSLRRNYSEFNLDRDVKRLNVINREKAVNAKKHNGPTFGNDLIIFFGANFLAFGFDYEEATDAHSNALSSQQIAGYCTKVVGKHCNFDLAELEVFHLS